MAKWTPKNPGLLSPDNVKEGEIITLLEEPHESSSGFLNVKVELEDGSHKLGGINDISGENLCKKWGSEMSLWVGKKARVSIRESINGKRYIVLFPVTGVKEDSLDDIEIKEDIPF